MKIVGLTGGIGSGKSSVSSYLSKQYPNEVAIIDADRIAREVVEPGSEVLAKLQEAFGADILAPDGSLNRALLAQRAFQNETRTKQLNAITHPAIRARIQQRLEYYRNLTQTQQPTLVLLDHPLLIESGMAENCDSVLVVWADPEIRCQRLVEQRGLSENDARQRMQQQLDDATRNSYADYLINNSTDLPSLHRQATHIYQELSGEKGGQ